ncbi:MAG: PilC/PilY family type IV pilus protein [Halioglobus sp.]
MKYYLKRFLISMVLFSCFHNSVHAEDIDIFTGTTEVNTDLPNLIFVLDNTSNWSNTAQKLPDDEGNDIEQGAAEVRSIRRALDPLEGLVNVGIVEFVTQGSASANTGGFVRYDLRELNSANKIVLDDLLDDMFDDIQVPDEKRPSNTPWGNLFYDLYNYLAGENQSEAGAGTPSTLADDEAYDPPYTKFDKPLLASAICTDTYVIFLSNPNQNGPRLDPDSNAQNLRDLYTALGESVPAALSDENNGDALPLAEPLITFGDPTPNGTSAQCYKNNKIGDCTDDEAGSGGRCDGLSETECYCTSEIDYSDTSGCSNNEYRRFVELAGVQDYEFGDPDYDIGREYNLDDWTQFLNEQGVEVTAVIDGESVTDTVNIITYTIDVVNFKPNPETSALLASAADVGGGEYYQANSEGAIYDAIVGIIGDILAVNSSFAAVTLPLSATNRARVDNEVYIGMFRPAKGFKPRWWGNLKRYQLALFGGEARLADANLEAAINSRTGFAKDCAQSFWTEESAAFKYWNGLGLDPSPQSECLTLEDPNDAWSDLPDGPMVEKGGVAQQLRRGPAGTARPIYVVDEDSGDLALLADSDKEAFDANEPNDPNSLIAYFRGDQKGINDTKGSVGLRTSIHGDVVHSRPLSMTYDDEKVLIYYGANDGVFRAVDTANGVEQWALIAPEQMEHIERLHDDTPLIEYTDMTKLDTEEYLPKQYFFDGPTGQYTEYAESDDGEVGGLLTGYIFPTMRRGGRMVYGLDVSDPNAPPDLLWRHGCTEAAGGCTHTDFSDIGQTWSTPISGLVASYVDGSDNPKPILMFGGGFDADCLNVDAATNPCSSSAKGDAIYILDAETGERVGAGVFTDSEMAPIVGEIVPADVDFDGNIDFLYALDVKGGLWRISFSTYSAQDPDGAKTDLDVADWTLTKIAESSDTNLRFLNGPAVGVLNARIVLSFGSGDRERPLESNYPYASSVQNRMYAIKDDTWVDRDEPIELEGDTVFLVAEVDPDDDPIELENLDGWRLELPDRGEQVANSPAIAGGKVFFNTFQPGGVADDVCSNPLGIGTGYIVDLFDPQPTEGEEIDGPGFPIPPVIATTIIPPSAEDLCEGDDCDITCDDTGCSCVGADCPDFFDNGSTAICPGHADCDQQTVCIGCQGFDPIEIIPEVDPLRRRIFFTEDIDTNQ